MRTTLFVAGFGSRTRARDLAYEFERYGRLVRCDIPAPKSYSSKPYAFVEFEDPRDAEDAYNEMHARRIDGYTVSVQWARNAPSSSWRFDRSPHRRRSPSPHFSRRTSYRRSHSRSPYRGRSPPPPFSQPPPPHHHHRGPSPSLRGRSPPPPSMYDRRPSYSRSPPPPPIRRHDDYSYPPPTSSSERRLSRSPSPYSRSSSPQRRSPSPRRSRSPEP
ncbi:hypothetical protein BJ944DRAFT_266151 [Cunninghamella echinulata]|nr:hypothetical protein BJ944DRAFT_266151 [Cunninghamella echinulata]